MELRLEEAMQVLARTPWVLTALLDGLDGVWIDGDEGPETFSPFEVVGHLLHGERTDWMPRIRIILAGEEGTFEPFDRFAHRERSRGRSLADLLTELSEARQENLRQLESMNLSASDLDRRGTHPALGKVTLGQFLAAWVVHDLGHLAQVARVMAKQYAGEVGPWHAFMPVLSDREPR
jgi:hypothetical protein